MNPKLRFDVFKRDGFTCQYCGRKPPEVKLEADHLIPRKEGGKDDIDNLITACFDCNRGKAAVKLEIMPDSMDIKIEAMKEKMEQAKEYQRYLKQKERFEKRQVREIEKIFQLYFSNKEFSDSFRLSVKKFISLSDINEVKGAMITACGKISISGDALSYFCGIMWRKIKGVEK